MAARERKSVWSLETKEIELLAKAFRGIQAKAYNDPESFFFLASYHGFDRFSCHHQVSTFLPWHRKYVRLFEDALRNIPDCSTVTLPYFGEEDYPKGLPDWAWQPPFDSFELPPEVRGKWPWEARYGFRTYRVRDNEELIQNLTKRFNLTGPNGDIAQARNKPTWSTFGGASTEGAHGTVHVAIGGDQRFNARAGWMSSTSTAAFDPVFWFHHSNVERWFYEWQKQHNATTVERMNKLSSTPIQWDVSFTKVDSRWQKSFEGTFREVVWYNEITYQQAPQTLPTTLLAGSTFLPFAEEIVVGGVEKELVDNQVVISGAASLKISNLDRSKIDGTFIVEITFEDAAKNTTLMELPVFQAGPKCDNCQANPVITVIGMIPETVVFPAVVRSIKVVDLFGEEIQLPVESPLNINVRLPTGHQIV